MQRNRNIILNILLLVAVAVFLLAAGRLLKLYLEYRHGSQTYEQLQEYVQEPKKDDETPDKEETESPYLLIDFEGLRAENPDIAAWIQIPALDVSYPVVQGGDNDYYLHHLFNREANKSGCIFIDYKNKSDFTDSNTIIYGHNMRDDSMFGKLDLYQDQKLYRQYPCFYIYVPGYVLEYQIVSCYAGSERGIGYTYKFSDVEEFQEFLDKICSYAAYDTGTEVDVEDKIVTLSTCVGSRRDYRYLVHGKLIRKIRNGERTDD